MVHAIPSSHLRGPGDGPFEAALLGVLAEIWDALERVPVDRAAGALTCIRLELLLLSDAAARLLRAGRLDAVQAFRVDALVLDLLETLGDANATESERVTAAQNQILDEAQVLAACLAPRALLRERGARSPRTPFGTSAGSAESRRAVVVDRDSPSSPTGTARRVAG